MKTFLKLLLCLGWVVATSLMISCSTVHKNISSTKKTVDSVGTLNKDTTSVQKALVKQDNFTATGVDVTLDFAPQPVVKDDTVKWTPLIAPASQSPNDTGSDEGEIAQLIKDAVGNYSSPGQIPYQIHVHIDSIKSGSQTTFTIDSTNSKEQTTSSVKTTVDTKTKVVSRSGLGFGTYVIIGLVVLVAIAIFVIKKFIL
jgi:hypothetical protein